MAYTCDCGLLRSSVISERQVQMDLEESVAMRNPRSSVTHGAPLKALEYLSKLLKILS